MAIPTSYESAGYNAPDGLQLGTSSTQKVGFYGKIPVVIRPYSSVVHATSGYVTSASFASGQLAIMVEIANTLVGLGIWSTV